VASRGRSSPDGDASASAIQVSILYRPSQDLGATDATLRDLGDATQRQMSPEYKVNFSTERTAEGLMLFFTVWEPDKAP
jgi:hypothetical protein